MKHHIYRLKRLGMVALLLVQLAATTQVRADESPHEEARRHFHVGVKLLKVEDFEGALIEFETSLQIRNSKATLFNLANTYQALHRYHEALRTITLLRAEFGNELGRKLTRHVDRIEADLFEIVAQVTINVTPAGAKIYYQERLIGEAPLDGPLYVGPGDHSILVSAEGYAPQELLFSVVSQEEKVLDIELASLGPGPRLSQTAGRASGTNSRRQLKPTAFWISTGITGALAVGFLVTDLVVVGRNNKIQEGGQSDSFVQTTQKLQTFDRALGITAVLGLVGTGILSIFTDFSARKRKKDEGFSLTGSVSFSDGPGFCLQGIF